LRVGVKRVELVREGFERKGRVVDALAQVGEEGRGKLREAPGSGKQALIRGCPNGGTWRGRTPSSCESGRRTWGTETSQYLEEEKAIAISRVAASERGGAQTVGV
jgi:hypothetical protein